jgi:hypothetical protein
VRRWGVVALWMIGCGRIGFDPLAGGSAPGGAPPVYVSGSRLRAVRVTSDQGGDQFSWFHDTQLDLDCVFALGTDGQPHCLPAIGTVASYYADAACTTPVAYGPPIAALGSCDHPMRYATSYSAPGIFTVYQLGAAWTGPVFLSSGTCGTATLETGSPVYLVGPIEPPTTFVGGTETIVPQGRLSYVEIEGEDGSRQRATALIDTATQAACAWVELEPGVAFCLPADAAGGLGAGFSDAACTQPAMLVETFGATPTKAYLHGTNACATDPHLYQLGSQVATFYFRTTAGCNMQALAPPFLVAFAVAGETSLAQYESATLVLEGSGRLQEAWFTTADGVLTPDQLWDANHGGRCLPAVDDRSLRFVCAPVFETGVRTYSDAGCTTAMNEVSTSCRGAPFLASGIDGVVPQVTCNGESRNIFFFDQPVSGPAYELDATGGCAPVDSSLSLFTTPTVASDATPLVTLRYDIE